MTLVVGILPIPVRFTVRDGDGSPMAGVTVTVSGGTVYSDSAFATPYTPVVSDSAGVVTFYALPGAYTFTCSSAEAVVPEPVSVLSASTGGQPTAAAKESVESVVTATSLLSNAETYVGTPLTVPAGTAVAGSLYRVTVMVTNTSTAQNTTIRAKVGTAGTTADANAHSATTTGTAANGSAIVQATFLFRTVGASGTVLVSFSILNSGATGFNNTSSQPSFAAASVDTTGVLKLGVSLAPASASVVTVQGQFAEVVRR